MDDNSSESYIDPGFDVEMAFYGADVHQALCDAAWEDLAKRQKLNGSVTDPKRNTYDYCRINPR